MSPITSLLENEPRRELELYEPLAVRSTPVLPVEVESAFSETLLDDPAPPSNWTRFFGALGILGGVGESIIGTTIGIGSAPTGAGPVLGGLLAAHGLDTASAGLIELTTGRERQTVTAKALSNLTGSETAGEVIDTGVGFLGGFAGAFARVTNGFRKLRIPKRWQREWRFGELEPNVLGSTDPIGNITIQRGLSGAELRQTLDHERVHRFFSPFQGAFAKLRAQFNIAGYNNSQLLRFTEEAIAEGYSTGSVQKGILHPLVNGYDITAKGLAAEAVALTGITADAVRTGAVLGEEKEP